MKISVSSYSFDQYIRAGRLTQLDAVKEAHALGLSAIEFIDLKPFEGGAHNDRLDYAKEIRETASKLGMTVNAYTVSASLYSDSAEERRAEVERLRGQLLVADALGARIFRHDVCWKLAESGKGSSFDGMLPDIAVSAREITEYAKSLGIRTCTENHGYIAQDSARMEKLFYAVGHENYGLLVDMGNFLCVDEDPAGAVSLLAPYAIHAHAKDFKVSDTKKEGYTIPTRGGAFLCPTVVGEGEVDVERCIRILKNAGYDGYLSIEYEGEEDCLTAIARGFENLRGMLG